MLEQDRIFMKNFALVIAGLAIFTVAIIGVAAILNDEASRPADTTQITEVEDNLRPVGRVYAGDTGRAELAAAEAAAAAAMPVAFDGSTDGELIYNNVCQVCHGAGVAGAPRLEASAWNQRLSQGMDVLIAHAIEGYQGSAGYMPAKGGRPDLSDEQVAASVRWMVDQL